MPLQEFETILTYLEPGRDWVSLLGGEPTLHSRFKEIVQDLVDSGYDVWIFTNGTTPQLRNGTANVPEGRVRGMLNLNELESYTADEMAELEANCRELGERLCLSFNIYGSRFRWDHLRAAVQKWQLAKVIRLGIAQPIRNTTNVFLPEEEMDSTCRRIVEMAEDLAEDGISLNFDCGFRVCAFSAIERGILAECGTRFSFTCEPVLDIGPGLEVWRCFPFSGDHRVKLTDFDSIKQLEAYFSGLWSEGRSHGNTGACDTCDNKRAGTCHGGCLSRSLLMIREGN